MVVAGGLGFWRVGGVIADLIGDAIDDRRRFRTPVGICHLHDDD